MDKNLQQIAFLKGCTPAFFDKVNAHAQHQSHDKGKIIFIHGNKAKRFYFIKSGWVKLFRETLDGTQAIIDVLPAGHIFGETSIFEDDTYPYSAEIVDHAKIISLPIAHLKKEIENNNKLTLDMLSSMARYRRQQNTEIEHRSL